MTITRHAISPESNPSYGFPSDRSTLVAAGAVGLVPHDDILHPDLGRGCSEPKRRTLRSMLLRVLVPRLMMFALTTTILGLTRLLSVHPSAQPAAEQVPTPMPSWTAADQRAHPRCVPSASWPEGKPADFVVVYSFRDHVRRKVAFAEAWKRNHNHTEADDIWVLGICPKQRGTPMIGIDPAISLRRTPDVARHRAGACLDSRSISPARLDLGLSAMVNRGAAPTREGGQSPSW